MAPIAFVLLGLWLLAGCFYLPLPEHRTDKSQKDFRDLVGDPGSKRPIRPGAVTRSQVLAALGPPPYASQDGRSVGYTLETERAAWVFPLCFHASPAKQRMYGLRLVFDESDRLTDWTMIHQDRNVSWFMDTMHMFPQNVIGALNDSHDAPELKGRPGPTSPPPTRPTSLPPPVPALPADAVPYPTTQP